MCGISGFLANSDLACLNEMNMIMAHRGPDASGVWYSREDEIGLGHNRLSIIDLSDSGKQPMFDYTGKVVIVFNGEIYNYQELRISLERKGHKFNSTSDTEVLLNLYLEKGTDLLDDIIGIFSFSIWDCRNKILFLARDGMGVKPLYYLSNSYGFFFASEIKSLIKVPGFKNSLSPEAIHYYFSYLWCPSPLTPFKEVNKLEPGYALIVKKREIVKKWQFYEIPIGKKIVGYTKDEASELCRMHLSNAVKRQMVADVDVGTFLSGGLDSSAITYFANLYSGNKVLKCFTMKYCSKDMELEGLVDDLPYAKMLAESLKIDLNIVDVSSNIFEQLPFMLYHLDEPQADPAPLNVFSICQIAKSAGVKVLLSGAGGDDLFTGYRRHQALMVKEKLNFIDPRLLKKIYGILQNIPERNTLLRRIKKATLSATFSGAELLESYFHWLRDDLQYSMYTEDFKEKFLKDKRVSPVLNAARRFSSDISLIDKMLYLELKYFLTDHNLNYTDKMSMATGVEVRVPFLDPDLVSFAFTLPANFKQRGTTGKWVLKKAMESCLPRKIIYRPKTGFGIPLRKVIIENTGLIMDDYLSKQSIENRGILDFKKVKEMVNENLNGKTEAAYSIFSFICMEIWMRVFLDGKKP